MKKMWTKLLALVLAVTLLSFTVSAATSSWRINPSDPYRAPVRGLFHEQQVSLEGASGQYSVYLPNNLEHCAPGVMVLVPAGTTARAFVESAQGQQWIAVSDLYAISTAFVEASGAGSWNTALAATGRDELVFLKQVSDNFHDKSAQLDAPFDLNEREFYVVGYESGGVMAHEFAMAWGTIIAGVATVGGSNVPSEVITSLGNDWCYPFALDTLAGREENQIPNKEIPVPVWIIESGESSRNSEAVEQYWVSANKAAAVAGNEYAQRVYNNEPTRVWVTTDNIAGQITADTIYGKFLSGVSRFVGEPGGRLARTVVHNNNGTTGYFFHEEMVDGYLRRWYTYVPTTYRKGQTQVPLVVAIHGYSSSIHAFTGDSRWQDVAEQNGFIVTFVQAYPNSYPTMGGNIDAPTWRTYGFGTTPSGSDDVAFIRHVVEKTKRNYDIDRGRIFATGHSNGSGMTWTLGLDASDIFVAIAPIGLNSGSFRGAQPVLGEDPIDLLGSTATDTGYIVPTWTMKGEFDVEDGAVLDGSNANSEAVSTWIARNGADAASAAWTQSGNFLTVTYTDGSTGAPLVKYTEVKNSPHAYMPTQSQMIWNQFFSKYSRVDGVLYYDGARVG